MLTVVVAVLVALAVAAVVVAASPTRDCRRCGGKRVIRTALTRRTRPCPRCHGTGRHYRRGAVLVHRVIQAVQAERRNRKEK